MADRSTVEILTPAPLERLTIITDYDGELTYEFDRLDPNSGWPGASRLLLDETADGHTGQECTELSDVMLSLGYPYLMQDRGCGYWNPAISWRFSNFDSGVAASDGNWQILLSKEDQPHAERLWSVTPRFVALCETWEPPQGFQTDVTARLDMDACKWVFGEPEIPPRPVITTGDDEDLIALISRLAGGEGSVLPYDFGLVAVLLQTMFEMNANDLGALAGPWAEFRRRLTDMFAYDEWSAQLTENQQRQKLEEAMDRWRQSLATVSLTERNAQ